MLGFMKKILSAIFITIPALIILAILAFVPSSNFTQLQKDDGFVIENYSVTMQVNEDNSIDVQENITAYFSLSSRGLVRNLPLQGYVSNVDEKGNVKTEIYDYTISNLKVESGKLSKTRSFVHVSKEVFLCQPTIFFPPETCSE